MLLCIGIVVIYSATFTARTLIEGAGTVNRQLVFIILGFSVYFLVSQIDTTYLKYIPVQVIIFMITIGLLVYVWIFGDPIRNTNRWIEWSFIRIQPSEYAKISLIILNSAILSNIYRLKSKGEVEWGKIRSKKNIKENLFKILKDISSFDPIFYYYILSFILSIICIVLVLIEPALGNATLTALICFSLFLFSYPNHRYLFGMILIFILGCNMTGNFFNLGFLYNKLHFSFIFENIDILFILISVIIIFLTICFLKIKLTTVLITIITSITLVFSISYVWKNVLKNYQKRRVEVFFNPEKDPQGAGWQLRQAKIAIGSGRFFGKGFLQGSQSKLRYLPEAYSDFIFAAFCEEFGLLGSTFLLSIYIFILIRILNIAKKANDTFESLICFGVAFMILIHVFVNTGMNMGIMPITGIPLPLVSYGGSSVMVTMIALGLVQAISMNRDLIDNQESLVITSKSFIYDD